MEIICVIYDPISKKVLLSKDRKISIFPTMNISKSNYSINTVIKFLETNYHLSISEEDFTEIFNNNQQLILLLRKNKYDGVIENWIELKEIQSTCFTKERYLKIILNYFFRSNELDYEPALIYLNCSNEAILKKCKDLIFHLNPGISNKLLKSSLGIVLLEKKCKNAKTITICLDDADENFLTKPGNERVSAYSKESIHEIYCKVMVAITNIYKRNVSEALNYLPSVFYGIAGLSESGKSYYSKYIDKTHCIWNLKISNFLEYSKYLVDENILSLKEVVGIKLLIDFACYHYFKEAFVIESIYSKNFNENLRNILKENYKLIYFDVSPKIRMLRSLDSKLEFINKEKKKESLGVYSLKNEADYVIDNSGLITDTQQIIDHLLNMS